MVEDAGDAVDAPGDEPTEGRATWSRRSVLKVGAGATVAVGAGGFGLGRTTAATRSSTAPGATSAPSTSPSASATPAGQLFQSRADLHPPRFEVLPPGPLDDADGLLLTTPAKGDSQSGPMIMDGAGRLVWFRPMAGARVATDLKVQQYGGRPVLTWWEGVINQSGWGRGELVIADDAYRDIARIASGDGLAPDLHDATLTASGTVLFVVYHPVTGDLRPVGGSAAAPVLDSGILEVDVATGRVVLEWMGSEHVDVGDTYATLQAEGSDPFDFLHVNSVAEDLDGNLLVSARHTSCVYKLDRRTGQVVWRMGGKRSDFALAPDAAFLWQHDATRLPDGRLSIFDNGAGLEDLQPTQPRSQGLLLTVDDTARTVALSRSFTRGDLLCSSQGSVEPLGSGDVVVGWGNKPYVTQFADDGTVRFDGQFLDDAASYRAFRAPWVGRPTTRPKAAVVAGGPGLSVAASWNGATEVATWVLEAGTAAGDLAEVARTPKLGFESTVSVDAVPSGARLVGVAALDAGGAELGRSLPARI